MTHATKRAPRRAATCPGPRIASGAGSRAGIPAAMLAALLLAGCSTGHIGESWQCPLAEGGLCDSVAAADPAVPDPKAANATVLAEPLWRVRAAEPETSPARGPGQAAETACPADCDGGFDPFAWLARLLGGGDGSGDRAAFEDPMGTVAGAARETPSASNEVLRETEAPASPPAREERTSGAAGPVTAALPAEAEPARDGPARDGTATFPATAESPDDANGDDLRTGEILARIWIAPFVDANGVYREASHVRVVLEPAGWRLP